MKKWIIFAAIGVLLSGCSTKFVYNNMDWLFIEYLEDYVELNDEQEELVSDKIMLLSEWHRKEEIPNYIEHLDELIDLDLRAFTIEDLERQESKFQSHSDRLIQRVAPELFELAQQLTDSQVEELMNNIRVRHTKYKKKHQKLSERESRRNYAEKIAENVDDWLGSVTKEQKQLIKLWSQELSVTSLDWIQHQTKMRVEMNSLFMKRFDIARFEPHFEQLMFDPTSYYAPQLEQKIDHNRKVANQYLVQMINSATDKQTEHYREELQDWKSIALDIQ
ncbi:DUF6279 family lipoprotein [Vibrio atypicus]|uniref:DUF6279 family lipoprotein n=1 Tax=Vibrio atypicus TaxID=558271 RepID=UPI0013583575|nr:DUF6279 family lipoprotein [Vibrio atypicus]